MTFNLVKDYVFPGFFLHLAHDSLKRFSNGHFSRPICIDGKFLRRRNFLCEWISFICFGLPSVCFCFFELQTDYFILSPATLGSCFKNNSSLTTTDKAPLKGHSQNCQVFLQWHQRVDHPLDTIGSITK